MERVSQLSFGTIEIYKHLTMGAAISKESFKETITLTKIKEYWLLSRRRGVATCSICRDNCQNNNYRTLRRCSHVFHRVCLREHRKQHGAICPTCNVSYIDVVTKREISSPIIDLTMNAILNH